MQSSDVFPACVQRGLNLGTLSSSQHGLLAGEEVPGRISFRGSLDASLQRCLRHSSLAKTRLEVRGPWFVPASGGKRPRGRLLLLMTLGRKQLFLAACGSYPEQLWEDESC